MKSFLAISSLVALALSAPCHQLSRVGLRIITPVPAHHTANNDYQQTLQSSNGLLHLTVGQRISLDQAPLRVQALEIVGVTEGRELASKRQMVAQDDWRVVCKAQIGYGSGGWVFSVEDGVVGLSSGEVVDVTGLECWMEGDEGLVNLEM